MAINYNNTNELIWSNVKMDIANRLDAVLCGIPNDFPYLYNTIKKAYDLVNGDLLDGMERDLNPLVEVLDKAIFVGQHNWQYTLETIVSNLQAYKVVRDRDYQDFINECEDREQVSLTTRFNFAK